MPHLPCLTVAANVMIDSGRFGNKKNNKREPIQAQFAGSADFHHFILHKTEK
jgi:hypothetical protein